MTLAGFDHTSFRSAEGFQKLLDLLDLPNNPVIIEGKYGYNYKNDKILLVTLYNPLKGSRYTNPSSPSHELGFSGYIGLEGDEDSVKLAIDYINDNADAGDFSPNSRGFI